MLKKYQNEIDNFKNKQVNKCRKSYICYTSTATKLEEDLKQKAFEDVIILSCGKLTVINSYKLNLSDNHKEIYYNGHANRLSNIKVEEVIKFLISNKDALTKVKSFHELIVFVYKNQDVYKNAQLTIYDICLRLGLYLGLKPDYIYLHAGALRGANAIRSKLSNSDCFNIYCKDGLKFMLKDDFANFVGEKLKPWEAEDFLCINKDKF